ncbi:Uncharacterised protein [Chlamydia trachomatis]|nr:Uncharacterised protein [Chlamydia trachomatis]
MFTINASLSGAWSVLLLSMAIIEFEIDRTFNFDDWGKTTCKILAGFPIGLNFGTSTKGPDPVTNGLSMVIVLLLSIAC